MTQFDFFKYKNDRLCCENADIEEIANKQGTPLYLYSYSALVQQFERFDKAFADVDHLICFSMKANSNAAVLKTFFNLGGGADVVSGGELRRALLAGCEAKKIVFSGVGKTSEEIHLALNEGILQFNVESEQELLNIQRIASFLDKRAPIAIRVNPDVDAKTHPYISTGLKQNKFGVSENKAIEMYHQARGMSHVDIVGIDCHIGSQLTELAPFGDALRKVRELVNFLKDQGVFLKHADIGGGLGIRYNDENAQTPEAYAATVLKPMRDLGVKIILEPGRYLVGNAGALITKVIYTKENDDGHKFTIIDAAFNDLMRPALYDAYHEINPVIRKSERKIVTTDIVGPICETGDTFSKARLLRAAAPGEYLAIMSAGAYGMSMSSTYNTRGRCSEVMVKDKQFFVVKKPDRLEDIIGKETLPEFLKDRS
jgi:diaminopimelate decarboxylase